MKWWGRKDTDSSQLDTTSQIQLEVNKVLSQIKANNLDAQTIRERVASAVSGGYDYADTLHNIYLDFGYPQKLQFSNYWNMYRRFGIAKNVIELPVDITWMSTPEIESNTKFAAAFDELTKQTKFWHRLKGLDTRQRVGRYAGMFMRVRDNKPPHEPLEGTFPGGLIQMIPVYEGQLSVLETNQDVMSDEYGNPSMYLYSTGSVGSRNEKQNVAVNIHPSRMVVAAEDADDGTIYGMSALEAPYNSLLDLRKIIGSGGEGFYKNAAQSIIFKLMDAASATENRELLDKLSENHDDFIRNRARRSMWTPGLEPSVLNSSLADPKEFFMAALNDVAAASKIPATILIGQQTGRLASDEDSKAFLSTINSRRENFVTEMITNIINWLIKYGMLPSADFEVVWDDLLEMSDAEKLASAEKMTNINKNQFASGGIVPFTENEIREQAGYKEMEEVPEEGEEMGDEFADDELSPDVT